ncbi:2-oxoglutarate-dependent dioxygenase AOP3-like [Salvia miltiorrhiza]|uniref:2-oxoglutarate-dependent dioxygenase AOP3-like n=1 Tax=Salvia miltiorrhiza TaxID=226208 RepID=UPI0025AD978A|nr:2-oxoglutarate-dependent dioxygenase AOP3-like [Salvia miltiorrhiza]
MAEPKLPTIKLKENGSADSLKWALESYGCAVIEYEEMSSGLDDVVFRLSEELFALPIETKTKHTSQLAGFGYGRNFEGMPAIEYFGIEHDATHLHPTTNFATLMWPNGNHHFW